MATLDNQSVPPGVYVKEEFFSPIQGQVTPGPIPVIVGTGNEELTMTDLTRVRGSSSRVDIAVPEEDETGRAVVRILETGQVELGNFNGARRLVQVRNFPIVNGDGTGTLATSTNSVIVTINGEPDVVLSIVDAAKGIIELSTAPALGADVRVSYFFSRKDTLTTDDVSEQVTATAAIIEGQKGQQGVGFEFTQETRILNLEVDEDTDNPVTVDFGLGFKNASTVVSLINGAGAGTSLNASVFTNNFGLPAIRVSAAQSLAILEGGANSPLGFTPGTRTNRRKTFTVFNGPIVVGDNGGVTTTDPARVSVSVNNQTVAATAVDGQLRTVTLPFAPEAGSTVRITYYFNTWQDTFDYLANRNVLDILRCGIVPGNSDYIEGSDFILKNDRILWGTSFLVTSGVQATGSTALSETQVQGLLVDNKWYLAPATTVIDTTVSPPKESKTQFNLPVQPTLGNGRNNPLGQVEFDIVSNGRIDVPTANPTLVQAYWGFDIEDALNRGPVEVLEISGTTITLKDPVDVGAKVWATFYYNLITDSKYTLEVQTAGPSGVGTYLVKDQFGSLLFTPLFGAKGPALTGVTVEFPSGSELTSDVRIEGGAKGPTEETVTVTFSETDGTLAKYTVPGFDPYYLIENASDKARFTIDNAGLAGGLAGIDLNSPHGVEGLGFSASLLGEEIQYDIASGLTTYDVLEGVNDSVSLTLDDVLINAIVPAQSAVNADVYVQALNSTAKLPEFAPFYTGTTRFLGTFTVSPGVYDKLRFHYTGTTAGASGPVDVTVPPGVYVSPSFLASALDSAFQTAITALPSAFDGLSINVSANPNGQMKFTFKAADGDLGTFASGTITVVAPERFEQVTIGDVTLTADLTQDPGGLNWNNGSARATITANGIRPADFFSIDIGGGPIVLTAIGSNAPGGFNEGVRATGTITTNGVLPGDSINIGGVTLTASGAQTPAGLNFNEGTRASGTATLASVLYGDIVSINGIPFTAGPAQTPGGLNFNVGTKATATATLTNVEYGTTVTVNGTVFTASNTQIGGAYDFNVGTQATATLTANGIRLGDTVLIGGVTLTAASSITPGNLDFNAGTPATGSFTVNVSPATATLDIGGILLTPAGGPRTSGGDDYDETLGSTAAIAAEIVAAINDPNNSFTSIATASPVGNIVNLTAVTPGAVGNLIATTSSDATISAAAATLLGGVGTDTTAASSLATAIADPLNGLTSVVTAVPLLSVVNLTAVVPGAAGNSIALSPSAPARLIPVAFAGGVGTNTTAAASLVAALTDPLNVPTPTEIVAVNVNNVVTMTAIVPGAVGNSLTLATSSVSQIAVSGAFFAGGVGTNITAASSLVAAISDLLNGLNGIVLASNVSGTSNVVTIQAYVPGAAGNAIPLATAAPSITLSGATLAGGVGTNTTVAASIVAAILDAGNGLTNLVTASNISNVVTVTALTPGNVGNTYVLQPSNGVRLAVSGATLAGGIGSNISVASSIVAAINDPVNGLSLTVEADNAGGTSPVVTVWAKTPGVLGNTFALASSIPARIVLSGALFTGGLNDIQIANSLVAAILDAGNGLNSEVTADNLGGTTNVVTVTAALPGSVGNAIALASTNALSLAVSGASLTGGIDLPGGYFEFLDAPTFGEDFAVIAGLSTDELPGESQTKILDADIARRFTVSGTSGRLIYDRIVVRNRIVPGSGSLFYASQEAQTQLLIQGNNAIEETGLKPKAFGLAGYSATVRPATIVGEVGFVNGQVPVGTYGDERDGQPVVRFYAEGGVQAQNNVWKVNIDGTPFTVVFKSALGSIIPSGGFADVPLGPAAIANTVLAQIQAAATAQGLSASAIRQEGAGIRLVSQRTDSVSSITIGNGNANDRLGYASGASALRTPVEVAKVVSALMSHHAPTLVDLYLDYQNPVNTYFAAQALAGIETDESGAEYLYLQSQANNIIGLGPSSNITLETPTADSWLLPGTGILAVSGTGAIGESGIIGFYVTSSDPVDGSGTANTSVFNNGVGQDGFIGQTYKDKVTGLTFTILPRADGGQYPVGVGSYFTFEVRNLVTTNANIPVNTIPGLELTVFNTTGTAAGNTATVETFERGGQEPAVGDFYYVSYTYKKELTNPETRVFRDLKAIEAEYGPADPDHQVSLAAQLAFQNGASTLAICQVPKEAGSNQASVASYISAFKSLEGDLPGGIGVSTITPLRGDSLQLFLELKRHCEIQSSLRYKKERTGIVGVTSGIQIPEVGAIAQQINSRRMTIIYPNIAEISQQNIFGQELIYLVDSTFLAACEAGGVASVDAATPRDRKQIFGIKNLRRKVDEVAADTLAAQGVTLYEQIGSLIRVRESRTTFSAPDPNQIFYVYPQTTRSLDATRRALRADVDRFIGTKLLPSTPTEVKGQITETLKVLKRQGILANFGAVSVSRDPLNPTLLRAQATVSPIFPLLVVEITLNVRTTIS